MSGFEAVDFVNVIPPLPFTCRYLLIPEVSTRCRICGNSSLFPTRFWATKRRGALTWLSLYSDRGLRFLDAVSLMAVRSSRRRRVVGASSATSQHLVSVFDALALGFGVEVGGGPLQVKVAQHVDHEELQRHAGVLLIVRGDDVPRRVVLVRALDGVLIRRHVVIPVRTLLHIGGIVLPVLVLALGALEQVFLLGFLGQVQEHLDHLDPAR